MSQSLRVRRDGDQIVLEDIEATSDYAGVLKATRLRPEDAILMFEAGLRMARAILRERRRETSSR